MDRDTLLNLAERVESAQASEQLELLMAAYEAVKEPEPRVGPKFEGLREWATWDSRRAPFMNMLMAKAYESAAMTLVPEGLGHGAFNFQRNSHGRCCAVVWYDSEFNRSVRGDASTPALALLAACLRAIAEGEG